MNRDDVLIGSLFSGIGGIDLGLERAGLGRVVWQVEIDPYCRGILAAHWPDVMRFEDVSTVGTTELGSADVICGGFPCQDVSVAGKRAGLAGARSGLWREYARIIGEIRPKIVVIENVPGLRTAGLRTVLADLASLGLDAEWVTFEAAWIGAPHLRSRIWIVATDPMRVELRDEPGWLSRAIWSAFAPVHAGASGVPTDPDIKQWRGSVREREPKTERDLCPDSDGVRRLEQAWQLACKRGWSDLCGWSLNSPAGVDDGFPTGMVGRSRKALGNAVVVPCAEAVGRAIMGSMT